MHKTKFIQCDMYILGDQHKKLPRLCAVAERWKRKCFQTTKKSFHARSVRRYVSLQFAHFVFSGGDFEKNTQINGSCIAQHNAEVSLWARIGAYKFQLSLHTQHTHVCARARTLENNKHVAHIAFCTFSEFDANKNNTNRAFNISIWVRVVSTATELWRFCTALRIKTGMLDKINHWEFALLSLELLNR